MSTCGRCGAPTPSGARFCPACGAAVAEAPAASQALKTVTVVFTDMVDSTALGERFDPESLNAVVREYYGVIRAVVERYGGAVEKFIGDAVVAVFGVPVLHEDDALRATSAAVAIGHAIADLSARLEQEADVTLEIRTGVNTGEVLVEGSADSSGRLVGDAVNVAARLQQLAAPGEILIGPMTFHLVRDHVRTEELEPLAVKGRSAPIRAHRLLEVVSDAATVPHPRTPIVGRERELRLVRETLDRVVADRTPHLFTVLGAPGVGKSRLVGELANEASAVVLWGRCLAYGEGITYWPLAEIIRAAAGIETDDVPDVARAKLRASAGDDDEGMVIADRVAHVASLSHEGVTIEEVFWGTSKYFERLARRQPLVLVFDDVHWAEPTMLDLLDHLVDAVGDVPLLVLCMARLELLELRPTWGGGKMNATNLVLGSLKEHESRWLLRKLVGDSSAVDEIADAVFHVAEGNPLFIEEMVAMLVDDGLLQNVAGRWRAVRRVAQVTIPPTIHALVGARLDRLSREEREVVGMAAVMGKDFVPRAITDLAPAPVRPHVADAVERLTRKQIVTPGESEFAGDRTYSFRHLVIRDTAYEHLPRVTRGTIHERYAEWLVTILGERVAEYDEIVGYHFEQAHLCETRLRPGGGRRDLADRAAERLADGGRRALARQDAEAAIKLMTRAADLVPSPDEKRLAVLPHLGMALSEGGEFDEAIAVFEEAIDLAGRLGDRTTEARCRIFNEFTRMHHDPDLDAEEARGIADEAIAVLTAAGDDYGLYFAWDLVAYIHDTAGRSDDALAALRKAGEHADLSGDVSILGHQKRTLLRSLTWGAGTVAEIRPMAAELLEWARARRDVYSETRALLTLALVHAMVGEFDVARSYVARQKEICSDVALELLNAWGTFEKTEVEMLAGDLDAAESEARSGCEVLMRKGEKGVLSTFQVQLADVLYKKGLLEEARAAAEAARDSSTPDDSLTAAKWRSVLAKVLARHGAFAEAIPLAQEAEAVIAPTGYLDWHAGILADLGEVLALAGRHDEAARAFDDAAALFARKGNVAGRRIVDALHESVAS